jgi:hypothetical protein
MSPWKDFFTRACPHSLLYSSLVTFLWAIFQPVSPRNLPALTVNLLHTFWLHVMGLFSICSLRQIFWAHRFLYRYCSHLCNLYSLHRLQSLKGKSISTSPCVYTVMNMGDELMLGKNAAVFIMSDIFRRVRKSAKSGYKLLRVCLSVRPHGASGTDFHEIRYLSIFRKSVDKIQASLKSDRNNESFTWRPMYIYASNSLNSS